MDIEIFKDIKGYEGLYQISNFGRVKSLERFVPNRHGSLTKIEERFLSPSIHKCGYVKYSLAKDGKMRTFLAHKLVATAFCYKADESFEVNHIDGDKTNNKFSNLEWVSRSYNTKHAYENNLSGFKDRVKSNLDKINSKNSYSKVILKRGNEILIFDSVSKASKIIGTHRDNITRAIRKNHKCGGWNVFGIKYANEETLPSLEEGNLVENIING